MKLWIIMIVKLQETPLLNFFKNIPTEHIISAPTCHRKDNSAFVSPLTSIFLDVRVSEFNMQITTLSKFIFMSKMNGIRSAK